MFYGVEMWIFIGESNICEDKYHTITLNYPLTTNKNLIEIIKMALVAILGLAVVFNNGKNGVSV